MLRRRVGVARAGGTLRASPPGVPTFACNHIHYNQHRFSSSNGLHAHHLLFHNHLSEHKHEECDLLLQTTVPMKMTAAVSRIPDGEFLTLIGSSSASNPARSLIRHFKSYVVEQGSDTSTDNQLLVRIVTARCRILLGLMPEKVRTPPRGVPSETNALAPPAVIHAPSTIRPLIPKHLLFGTKKKPQRQQEIIIPAPVTTTTNPPASNPNPLHNANPPVSPSQRSGLVLDMCRLGIPLLLEGSTTADKEEEILIGEAWDRIMSGCGGNGSFTNATTVAAKKELLVPIITSLNSQWIVATSSSSGLTPPASNHRYELCEGSSSPLPHPMARHVLHCVNELGALVDLHLEHCHSLTGLQEEERGSNSHPSVSRRRRRSFFRRGSRDDVDITVNKRRPQPPLSVRDVIDSLVFLSRCYEAITSFNNRNFKPSVTLTHFTLSGTSEVDMGYLLSETHRGVIQCITALSLQLLAGNTSSSSGGDITHLHTQEEDLLSGGGGGLEEEDMVILVSLVRTLKSTAASTSFSPSVSVGNNGTVGGNYLDRLQRSVGKTLGRFNRRDQQQLDANQLDHMLLDVLLSRTLADVWGCGATSSAHKPRGRAGSMLDFTLSPSHRVSILSTLSEMAPTHALVKTLTTRMAEHAVAHIPVSNFIAAVGRNNDRQQHSDELRNIRSATKFILGLDSWSTKADMDTYIIQLFRTMSASREVSRQSIDFHAGGALATLLLNRCLIPSYTSPVPMSLSATWTISSSATAVALRALLGEQRAHRGVSARPHPQAAVDVMTTRLQLSRWTDLLVVQPLNAILITATLTNGNKDSTTPEVMRMIRRWWDDIRVHLFPIMCSSTASSPPFTHDDIHLSLLLPLLTTALIASSGRSAKAVVDACVVLSTVILSDEGASMNSTVSPSPSSTSVADSLRKAARLTTVIEVGCLAVLLLEMGKRDNTGSISTSGVSFNMLSVALSLVANMLSGVGVRRDVSSPHSSRRTATDAGVVVRGHNREHLRRMVEAYNHYLPHYTYQSTTATTSHTANHIETSERSTTHHQSYTPKVSDTQSSSSNSAARVPIRSDDTVPLPSSHFTNDADTASLPSGHFSVQLIEPRVIRTLQAMCT